MTSRLLKRFSHIFLQVAMSYICYICSGNASIASESSSELWRRHHVEAHTPTLDYLVESEQGLWTGLVVSK